jgi:GTPase SAR1 family protein
MSPKLPLGPAIETVANEALRERGHANVFLVGRAGVGKSTLVNAVFDGNLARVGPTTIPTQTVISTSVGSAFRKIFGGLRMPRSIWPECWPGTCRLSP